MKATVGEVELKLNKTYRSFLATVSEHGGLKAFPDAVQSSVAIIESVAKQVNNGVKILAERLAEQAGCPKSPVVDPDLASGDQGYRLNVDTEKALNQVVDFSMNIRNRLTSANRGLAGSGLEKTGYAWTWAVIKAFDKARNLVLYWHGAHRVDDAAAGIGLTGSPNTGEDKPLGELDTEFLEADDILDMAARGEITVEKRDELLRGLAAGRTNFSKFASGCWVRL